MNNLKQNQPVWYPKANKKAVIKDFLPNGLIRLTYFDTNDDRQLADVLPDQIKEYREPLTIKVKYFTDIKKIAPLSKGDWVDLRAAEDLELKAYEYKLIPLGVGMKLPKEYEANVVPRSSTFKNWGIIQTNHFGVIDNSYSGNADQWHFPAYATRDTIIKKNDRICQFRVQKIQPKVKIVEVDNLDDVSRGGIGSTGKN